MCPNYSKGEAGSTFLSASADKIEENETVERDTRISHFPKAITSTEKSCYNKSFLLSKCEISLQLHSSAKGKKSFIYQIDITN